MIVSNLIAKSSTKFLFVSEILCKEQQYLDCDVNYLAKFDKDIYVVDSTRIHMFLGALKKTCINNVEFMEYYNELMYKTLLIHTDMFLKIMDTNSLSLEIDLILDELSNPIHEGIKLNEVLKKTRNFECYLIVDKIIKAVSLAKSKY